MTNREDRKLTLVSFVDKDWPPQHSFIDGMLARELAESNSVNVLICVSGRNSRKPVRRYLSAIALVKFRERRGLKRFTNGLRALQLGWHLCLRAKRKKRTPVLFVRNDPVYLFSASVLRALGLAERLVFQSSFPHEQVSDQWTKRFVAKMLYKASSLSVDAISAVSPAGLRRVEALFPSATAREWIPLLADMGMPDASIRRATDSDRLKFVYIGTHHPSRSLEIVFEGILLAANMGCRSRYRFIGGSATDVERLRSLSCLSRLEADGVVEIMGRVPRPQIPSLLLEADVGLSLIPPRPEFQELSPTKLVEYMGAGLASLASRGIPLQEEFARDSEGVLLVDFNPTSISQALQNLEIDYSRVQQLQNNSAKYAASELQYRRYLPQMRKLLEA